MNINLSALTAIRSNPKEYYCYRVWSPGCMLMDDCIDPFKVSKRKRRAVRLLRYFGGRV
jgi:hypothetical protein